MISAGAFLVDQLKTSAVNRAKSVVSASDLSLALEATVEQSFGDALEDLALEDEAREHASAVLRDAFLKIEDFQAFLLMPRSARDQAVEPLSAVISKELDAHWVEKAPWGIRAYLDSVGVDFDSLIVQFADAFISALLKAAGSNEQLQYLALSVRIDAIADAVGEEVAAIPIVDDAYGNRFLTGDLEISNQNGMSYKFARFPRVVIGRIAECDIRTPEGDTSVSGLQALLRLEDDGFVLHQLSKNVEIVIFRGGKELAVMPPLPSRNPRLLLVEGDVVEVGNQLLTIERAEFKVVAEASLTDRP